MRSSRMCARVTTAPPQSTSSRCASTRCAWQWR
jgi:hypothetical protein